MDTREPARGSLAPEAAAFVGALIDNAARQRLPDFFSADLPELLYQVPNRQGIGVRVVRTAALAEDQLLKLLKYRLAQYLAVSFVDPAMIYRARIEHEPLSSVSADDVHLIAGSVETGEILCYATLRAPPPSPAGTTLRSRERPVFPVEKVHGWGIFNRLRVLPDLPLSKIRELGRFVKNQRLHVFDELGTRAPIEVGAAILRTLAGPLRLEVEGIVSDLEEGVAKQNLEYFRIPLVIVRGTVPYEAEASYFFPRYQYCTVYPWAFLPADISADTLERLAEIEAALGKPGKQGVLALLACRRRSGIQRSSLEPREGLAPLAAVEVPQRDLPMPSRQQLIDFGQQLRATRLFRDLSVAEAAILGTFMERRTVAAGGVVIRQGEQGDSLFLIESGEAEVRVKSPTGQTLLTARLGPGEYVGEIALATGGQRSADVVAATSLELLELSREAYEGYLTHVADVEQQVTRTAMDRAQANLHHATRTVDEPGSADAPFLDLTPVRAVALGPYMERRRFDKDDLVVQRGGLDDGVILVESGQAEVRVSGPDGALLHAEVLGPGACFGQLAVATEGPRTADVVALTPLSVVWLSREGYQRFLTHLREIERHGATVRDQYPGRGPAPASKHRPE